MKNNLLSQAEQQVMDVFWSVDTPLTSVELSKHSTEKGWKSSYIYILIRSLLKKQMIEPCGTLQYGTQYARQFKPIVSKEEYAARLALSINLDHNSVCKVAVSLAQQTSSDTAEIVKQLEDIIQEFRKETLR